MQFSISQSYSYVLEEGHLEIYLSKCQKQFLLREKVIELRG